MARCRQLLGLKLLRHGMECEEMKTECDILAENDHPFILLLPETPVKWPRPTRVPCEVHGGSL